MGRKKKDDGERKRLVKWFKRTKSGTTYRYAWIGYYHRNSNGTPTFVREINLSGLGEEQVNMIAAVLKSGAGTTWGEVSFEDSHEIGAAWVALRIAEDLGIVDALREALPGKHATAMLAMLLDRIVNPFPFSKRALCDQFDKLPYSQLLPNSIIPLQEWYRSLGAAYRSQDLIERQIATPDNDRIFLYDITSTYFEGDCCPLAEYGYNRDGKKGKKQIVIGLLTNSDGRPLAIRVFPGNTKDESTVADEINEVRIAYGAERLIFIGDRGMLPGHVRVTIDGDEELPVDYITALRHGETADLIDDVDHPVQLGLFDKDNLAEVEHEGKRYVLCFNPLKLDEDRATRERLMEKTREKLEMIKKNVEAGNWKREKVIAKRLHRWWNRWGMERFYSVDYGDSSFSYSLNEDVLEQWEQLDGCYVILSTVQKDEMDTEQVRMRYKSLIQVEQAFRHMKTTDEFMRPIRHWSPDNVRGHVLLCMLAYLVIWEARNRFAEFLERDPETRECEAGSLREIWAALNHGVIIGVLKVGEESQRQLKPVSEYTNRLLQAAGAVIGKSEKERLNLDM